MMGWDEILEPGLPKEAVIHSWRGQRSLVDAAKQGYDGVLSAGYYIDLMNTAATHYAVDPLPASSDLTPAEAAHVLGGEATMWGEWVGPETIDSRIWPRTAAIAERFWSPRDTAGVDDMYRRLAVVSVQLEELGIAHLRNADVLLRRLTAGADPAPLRVLADVVEPVKGYQRGGQQPGMTTLGPLTHLVDAVSTDSMSAREVNTLVEHLLSDAPHFMLGRERAAEAFCVLARRARRDRPACRHGAGARRGDAARRRSGGDGRGRPRRDRVSVERHRPRCRVARRPDRDADAGRAAEGRARVSVRARHARARGRRRRAGAIGEHDAGGMAREGQDARGASKTREGVVPTGMRLVRVLIALSLAVGTLFAQDAQRLPENPQKFSPLGYYDLRAYEQAYPAPVGDPRVTAAAQQRYWVFRGVAYRGQTAIGSTWASLGPDTTIQNPDAGGTRNISGRVAALAISPYCFDRRAVPSLGRHGRRRRVAHRRRHEHDRRRLAVGRVKGSAPTASAASPSIRTIAPATRFSSARAKPISRTTPPRARACTDPTDGGDHWTRIPTMIVDPAVSPVAIDFTFTRGIGSVVVEPGNAQTIYVATTSAMLGMTAVRGGQTQTTGFPQPRVGLYKTTNAGATWTLIWVPPLDPVVPPNPNLGEGVGDTMFGVRHVKLDPKDPHIVYATAWNNAIHRSAPSLEGGDATFKPVFAVVNLQRFQDLAMFALTQKDGHTRMYVYNGTLNSSDQALYRLDNADVPAATLVTGSGASLFNSARGSSSRRTPSRIPDPPADRSARRSASTTWSWARRRRNRTRSSSAACRAPDFGEATMRSTNAGVSFTAFGNDAQNPRNTSHVDVRAIVFHPARPEHRVRRVGRRRRAQRRLVREPQRPMRAAVQSGAGAVRHGAVRACRQRIYFLNRGLQTLQFYNVAVDPCTIRCTG